MEEMREKGRKTNVNEKKKGPMYSAGSRSEGTGNAHLGVRVSSEGLFPCVVHATETERKRGVREEEE